MYFPRYGTVRSPCVDLPNLPYKPNDNTGLIVCQKVFAHLALEVLESQSLYVHLKLLICLFAYAINVFRLDLWLVGTRELFPCMPSTTYLQLVQHSLLSYSGGQMFVTECLLVLVAWRQ